MSKEDELKALVKSVSDFGRKHDMDLEAMLLMLDEIEGMLYEVKAHPSYPNGVVELREALEDESF